MTRRAVGALGLLLASACSATGPWVELFDGKGLDGWHVTEFGGEGEVYVEDHTMVLGFGAPLTGVTWTGPLPHGDYEISVRGARRSGTDFFCGLTFPVGESHCTLVLGGWGGVVIGLSCIDGRDADSNDTRCLFDFEEQRFYDIRLRVMKSHISAWVDGERIVHQDIRGRVVSLRSEVSISKPFGLAAYQTEGGFTRVAWRPLR